MGCSLVRQHSELAGPLNKMHHLSGGADCRRVSRVARPGRNVHGHVSREHQLPISRSGEQCHHQVLQCNHANVKLLQLGICQRGNVRLNIA